MCGRFSSFTFRDIKVRWHLQGGFSFEPRYNIAPSQSVPVIVHHGDGKEAKLMKWGLVPSWASDPSVGPRMINARAETLLQKPSFRELLRRRRCLVPADGFYEWQRDGKRKVPIWIHFKNKEPFVFAGLWDTWRGANSADVLNSFTIITTEPNALLRPIHDRMPVIYDLEMGWGWLERRFDSATALRAALRPCSADLLEAWEVPPLVNCPENDSPACIQPLAGQTSGAQLRLL